MKSKQINDVLSTIKARKDYFSIQLNDHERIPEYAVNYHDEQLVVVHNRVSVANGLLVVESFNQKHPIASGYFSKNCAKCNILHQTENFEFKEVAVSIDPNAFTRVLTKYIPIDRVDAIDSVQYAHGCVYCTYYIKFNLG